VSSLSPSAEVFHFATPDVNDLLPIHTLTQNAKQTTKLNEYLNGHPEQVKQIDFVGPNAKIRLVASSPEYLAESQSDYPHQLQSHVWQFDYTFDPLNPQPAKARQTPDVPTKGSFYYVVPHSRPSAVLAAIRHILETQGLLKTLLRKGFWESAAGERATGKSPIRLTHWHQHASTLSALIFENLDDLLHTAANGP
jgi:hypothetical protein